MAVLAESYIHIDTSYPFLTERQVVDIVSMVRKECGPAHEAFFAEGITYVVEVRYGSWIGKVTFTGTLTVLLAVTSLSQHMGHYFDADFLMPIAEAGKEITGRINREIRDTQNVDPKAIISEQRRTGVVGKICRVLDDIDRFGHFRAPPYIEDREERSGDMVSREQKLIRKIRSVLNSLDDPQDRKMFREGISLVTEALEEVHCRNVVQKALEKSEHPR